jgi:hypothetical protein
MSIFVSKQSPPSMCIAQGAMNIILALFKYVHSIWSSLICIDQFTTDTLNLGSGEVLLYNACSAERTFAIVRMRSLLNYSEHCHLEASAREQSRVNRPLTEMSIIYNFRLRSKSFLSVYIDSRITSVRRLEDLWNMGISPDIQIKNTITLDKRSLYSIFRIVSEEVHTSNEIYPLGSFIYIICTLSIPEFFFSTNVMAVPISQVGSVELIV